MEHEQSTDSFHLTSRYTDKSEQDCITGELHKKNIAAINADIELLMALFHYRIRESEGKHTENAAPLSLAWPTPDPHAGPYANLCHTLSVSERILLLCSLLPHYSPKALRIIANPIQEGLIITNPDVGGYIKRPSLLFIPSLETVIFLCAGIDLEEQQLCYRQLIFDGSLLKRQIISLRSFNTSEPVISDKELIPDLAEEYVHYILQGRQPRPDFGKNFPAKILVTEKTWDQLILNASTRTNIELLIDWVENGVSFSEQTKGYFNPGYPALFYGPPGTGKSLCSALIGKHFGLNVFRVDASRIVSKYIGETEKNLVGLFERMKLENDRQSKKPILFFDEADVLFSKRTEIKDAKDKWANMETSVLLPLIEEYGGLVIVATNLEYNLDPAMDRRFQLKIKFPSLAYNERVLVWEKGLPPAYSYPSSTSAHELARYKLTPASIINVLKGGCMQAHKRGSTVVTGKDMERFISLEFAKSGLTPSWENKQMGLPEIIKIN